MNTEEDYTSINKDSWNQRAEVHFDSAFYDNKTFLEGRSSLNDIELSILGDVTNKSVLHLQCHFGQDTISLSRLGAKATGIDFSDKAIEQAKSLAKITGTDTEFICSDVYGLPEVLDQKYDVVFTSYGTIGWLPDIHQWAKVVNHFIKPGGRFVFAEFHPLVWMYDNDFTYVQYSYFNAEPIVESESGTYTDKNAPINPKTITWNHGIGEVVSALIGTGLQIELLKEFDYSPYNCFNKTYEFEPGRFRLEPFGDKIPMVYALSAKKV